MATGRTQQSRWRTWVLPTAVVLGVGPWGGLAGGALFAVVAFALGAPHSFDSWGLWVALVGFTIGFAASSWAGLRLVRRSPRAVGTFVVVLALLFVVPTAADRSGWDALYLFAPGAALAAVVVWATARRHR